MEAPDCLVGQSEACPFCGHYRKVPKGTPQYAKPTQQQLKLAGFLKLELPGDISRGELGELLAGRPTLKQLELAAYIGLDVAEDATQDALQTKLDSVPWQAYPATEKQKEFAKNLGIPFSPDIRRGQLTELLDKRLEKMPPSAGQLELAKELGIRVPWFCSYKKMSQLLDEAMQREDAYGYADDYLDEEDEE